MSFPVWLVGTGTVLSPTGVADTVSSMLSCGSCPGLEYFSHTCVFPLVLSPLLPSNPLQVSGGLCLSALTPLWYSLQGSLPAYAHLNSQLLNPDRLQVSNSSPPPLAWAWKLKAESWGNCRAHIFGFSSLRDHCLIVQP